MGPQTIIWNSELAELNMIDPGYDFEGHYFEGNFNHPYWELFEWLVQMEHLEIDGAMERVAGFTNPNHPLLHWLKHPTGILRQNDEEVVAGGALEEAKLTNWTDLKSEILKSLGIP